MFYNLKHRRGMKEKQEKKVYKWQQVIVIKGEKREEGWIQGSASWAVSGCYYVDAYTLLLEMTR